MPTYVVALIASKDKENATDIQALHQSFLTIAREAKLDILSIGSDGAPVELAALEGLSASASTFLEYSNKPCDVHVKIPLLGIPPRPLVMVQDPKHARKTGANQVLAGARWLSFGFFELNIGHLALILQSKNSSLYKKDVFDCDRQDDGRAYRMFNDDTLKIALDKPECKGLALYLFVIGELIDSWLSRTSSHASRLLSSQTALLFLRRWRAYLLEQESDTNGLMSVQRNYISPQSHKIFEHISLSLLQLIVSHREYYPGHPLCPWKHGTEACEHIFGWMRILLPNFTILEALQLMPKIFTVVKSIMTNKVAMPKSEHIHSGLYRSCVVNFTYIKIHIY